LDRPHDAFPLLQMDSAATWRAHDLQQTGSRFTLSEPLILTLSETVDIAMSYKLPMSAVNAEKVPALLLRRRAFMHFLSQ
jgi:hypothetical protein